MTIRGNVKFTLDGKTKFTVGDETFKWSDQFIDLVNVYAAGNKTYTSTVTLKGADWGLSTIRFVGSAHMKTVIQDGDSLTGRHIEYILAGNAGSNVVLKSTEVGLIGGSSAVDKVTTGTGGVDFINLHDGNDILKLGKGYVGSILMGNGNDTVTAGAGFTDQISLGSGTNSFTGGSGWVGSVLGGDDKDTVRGGTGNIEQIAMGAGNNVFIGGDGSVGSLRAGDGNDTITVKNGSLETILVGNGLNTINIAGSGWIASIVAYDGKDVLNITGSSQVGSINLGSGNNIIHTGSNWVGSIITYGGDDTVTIGAGGAELVTMGHGKNTLVATGWVGTVLAYSGNDTVTLGGEGAGHVGLYGGADIVHVSELTDIGTTMIDGGAGTDTIDFGGFTTAVQISLADPTEYESGDGMFVVTGFENLTTGSGADTLTGSSVANILIAGTGNDDITGGGGADKFVFASGDGTDTIQDFSIGDGDVIDLSAVTQFDNFADLQEHMAQVGSNVEISDGAGDKIILVGVTLGDLTASQFAFA